MNTRHLAAVLLVLAGVAALAVPTVGVSVDVLQDGPQENETAADEGLGEQVSAFAQASAADSENTVERGMWGVRLANDSEDVALEIENRSETLEQRLNRLERRSDELSEERENLSRAEYNARASAVRAEMANLRAAVHDVEETADRHGINSTKLDVLRSNAANMTGPEVSELARNLTDPPRGPPMGVGAEPGPPADRGPEDAPGNATGPGGDAERPDDDGPGNQTGVPTDGNGSQAGEPGPPDNSGPSDDNGPRDDTGPSDGSPGAASESAAGQP